MNSNKITSLALPPVASDAATKDYVATATPVFKTAFGVLGSAGSDNTLLQCTAAKTPQNCKIFVSKLWLERGSGEWFSAETSYVGTAFGGSFQYFYRASTQRVAAFFESKSASGWTNNFRMDYLEYA